jgi:hypothetical protein
MAAATVWPDDAQLAMSFVVNVEEGAEHNPRDGDRHPEPVDELGIALKRPPTRRSDCGVRETGRPGFLPSPAG